jgi:hypothetical protein
MWKAEWTVGVFSVGRQFCESRNLLLAVNMCCDQVLIEVTADAKGAAGVY